MIIGKEIWQEVIIVQIPRCDARVSYATDGIHISDARNNLVTVYLSERRRVDINR